jgi:glycosyltransferase involved in cell wall biosynthesis
MRVAYFFTDLPDVEGTFPVSEIEGMADRGFRIEIFCLRSRLSDGPAARRLRERFPVHRAPYASWRGAAALLAYLAARPKTVARLLGAAIRDTADHPRILVKTLAIFPKSLWFARQIERARFDWLQAYWASLPGRAALWASELTGTPFGTWAHAGADIYNRRHQTEAGLRRVLRGASLVLTCNRTNLAYFPVLLPPPALERVSYQPHGIDVDRFRPAAPRTAGGGPLRLLSVGRLSEAKGFGVALRACKILKDRGWESHYRILGEGPDRPSLEALVSSLGLDREVDLPGFVPNQGLPAELARADVFLVPSVIGAAGARDGLPNALLEAMACAIPAIGSDAVGIPEAIRHGETGLLVPPGDPAALADAIVELAADPVKRLRMGENGRRLVRDQYARPACMESLAGRLRRSIAAASSGR